ncbi:hypothetical protein [Adhaeretor mobilis]|uniref:Uncharacterized protein n=1 Tax=Adhaeretor mobilis TaxID=1930276 RepID=A0A517N0L3_9BACT|nr:hypothetical protein [Adhaeretor mobilis]QDT00568.1 hypothetical protein HG15A2_39060 [Adhaeretor mobilis]
MIAVLLATLSALLVAWGSCIYCDEVDNTHSNSKLRAATLLLSTSVWIIVLVETAQQLQLPGSSGPVQYSLDEQGQISALFFVRVFAMLVILANMVLAVLVVCRLIAAAIQPNTRDKWRLCLLPIMSLAAFAFAYYLFFTREFSPAV